MNIYLRIYSILNKHRRYIPVLIDTFIAIISYAVPYIAVGMVFSESATIQNLLTYVTVYILTFFTLKVYKNMWRYSGVEDICYCLVASVLGNIFFFMATKLLRVSISNYVHLFALALSVMMSIGARIVYRAILIIGNKHSKKISNIKHTKEINTMIIGAGQATFMLLNELSTNNPDNYSIKCIIDDASNKIGRRIQSIPVAGDTSQIIEMAKKYEIQEIFFSIPSIDKENKKRILDICAKTGCKLRILPEIYTLISEGQPEDLMGKLRDVQVEDLLGREQIAFDCSLTKKYIENKTVLITGGGGSIGSELCRQVARYSPKHLIILDIYENNVYEIQQELLRAYGDGLSMEVEIASIRDKLKLEKIFASRGIDIVFHAAAHKHVPLMEKNPEESIKNNVMGTYNVALMANKYNAEKFILISTDKAVNPTNIMGATKRVCEMIIQSFNKRSFTDYVAVRFGNVLGSNGSVIPLFMEQIKSGGPVTVTHEEITRYFMTIPEAVQLVLRAASIAKGGEIFVLDMGEPVKIKDLAYNLIRLSGLEPNEDIDITYTGLRPGEKLYEELLITSSENQTKTEIDKVFIEKPIPVNELYLFDTIKSLEKAAHDLDENMMLKLLEELVPTYKRTPNGVEAGKNWDGMESMLIAAPILMEKQCVSS